MRKLYCLLAMLLLLGLTGSTARVWADQPSDPKAVPQIEESLAASLGKDIVEAAHPSAKNISILEYKQSKSDGHLVASLKMRYHGKLTGAKYTANISITIDPAKTPLVLDVVYKDDNRIPANKKGLQGVRQNLETRLKNAWDARQIAKAQQIKLARLLASSSRAANRPELVLQTGHTASVTSVSFSPDGKRLATASYDKTAIVWDAASGQKLRTLKGHTRPITSVSFSPDGKRLATASYDDMAVLWNVESGEKIHTLKGHTNSITSVSFSPDGKRLVTASHDKTVVLWDVANGNKLRTLKGHTGWVHSVSFSPDGKRLATASYDNTAIVWDAASGEKLRTLKGHTSFVTSVSFSPDGKRLATGAIDKTAVVWDTASGDKLRILHGHTDAVNSVSFSPDGKRLATASSDKTAVVWDKASGDKLRTFRGHTGRVTSVSFSPDGKRLATGSEDKTVVIWDAATGEKIHTLTGHTDAVASVSFSPDGKRLATASSDKTAVVWDKASGDKLRILHGHTDAVNSVSFSPDGKRLATASSDKTAVVWDKASGDKLRTFRGHTGRVTSVSFSPDGKRLATGSEDKTVVIWDAATGEKIHTLTGHTAFPYSEHNATVMSVSFSPDGKRLATASKEWTAMLWDAVSGKKIHTLLGHTGWVHSVSFSPDGKRLATASNDKTAVLWDTASGEKLRTLRHIGVLYGVYSVSFSPDGKQLATGSEDETAVIWDVARGEKCRTLMGGHTGGVLSVSFSPDGKWVCTGSEDGTAALWDAETGAQLVRLISLDAGRDWLVVTPEGLFDGSKAGMQKVSFRIRNGLDVRQVEDYFNDFYYPGLLAAIFKGERPRPAAKIALPPNVKFLTPAYSATVESVTQTIDVEAIDAGGGVKSIALFLNGTRVEPEPSKDARQPNPKAIRQRFTICLVQGDNRLEARAAGGPGAGEGKAEPIVLKYLGPLDRPNLYVLAIGVGNYQQEGLKLDYPVTDANDFADLFQKRRAAQFAKVAVTRLLDADATTARIEGAFKAIAQTAQAQDVLIVTLAGHGKTIGQRYYFLPFDFKFDDPDKPEPSVRKYGIAADEMATWMRPIKTQKRAWFIDTCNSGGAIKQLLRQSLDRDPFAFRGAVARLNRAEGMFIIAAGTKNEQAKENKELGHGLLSYSLLAAAGGVSKGPLKNKPAKPEIDANTLDIGTWLNYAKDKMPALMKLYFDNDQDVVIGTDGGQSFALLSIKP